MEKLNDVWKNNNYQKDLKVRYVDWNFKHKYFQIKDYSSCGTKIVGLLDTGEQISYPIDSEFWVLYELGHEQAAKPV